MMYQKDTMSLNNTNCNESYHCFFNNKKNIIFNNFILFLINIDEKNKKPRDKAFGFRVLRQKTIKNDPKVF